MKNSRESKNTQVKSKTALIENIPPTTQIQNPHKFTQNTLSAFEKILNKIAIAQRSNSLPSNYQSIIKSIHRGRLVCHQPDCFHVTVSESLFNRAIRFLDGFAKELENSEFKIQSIQKNEGKLIVVIKNNEYFSFKISEGYKYRVVDKDIKSRSELDKLLYRDKEPITSKKLTLFVYALETKISKSWSDGVRLIEDELPNIINAFDSLILKQKQRKVENAIKTEQRKEFTKIFRENESKYYLEKSIYDSAMQESQSFIAQRNLESYLNYLEGQYLKKYGCLNDAAISWLSTVRKFAETQNPINKRIQKLSAL